MTMDIQSAILTVPHDHYIFCRTIDRWEHFENKTASLVRGGFVTARVTTELLVFY